MHFLTLYLAVWISVKQIHKYAIPNFYKSVTSVLQINIGCSVRILAFARSRGFMRMLACYI